MSDATESSDSWTCCLDTSMLSKEMPLDTLSQDFEEKLKLDEQPGFDNVEMSEIWRDLPIDIQNIVIDYLAYDAFQEMEIEDDVDPIIRMPGVFSDTARAKSWNHLVAVGGHFSYEVLRKLIRWEWWTFENYDVFSMAIQSWQIVSPGCWNQIRVLTLGQIRLDGSNCQDIIDLLPKVSLFSNLTWFRVIFEKDEPEYFDRYADLDETYPKLFAAIEAVRLPRVWCLVFFLKNDKVSEYLESVMTGIMDPVVRKPNTTPYWRRDSVSLWNDDWS